MMLGARTAAWSYKPLPYDAEVEWLENTTSDQFIDTLFVPKSDKLEIDIVQVRTMSSTCIAGIGSYGNGLNVRLYSGNGCEIAYGNKEVVLWSSNFGGVNNRVRVVFGNGNARSENIDKGISCSSSLSRFDFSKNIRSFYLFSSNDGVLSEGGIGLRTLSCKIIDKEDNNTLFEAIPVRFTNENGEREGAMFDNVSKRLLRNSGTGAFIIGPDKTT